MRDDIDNDLMRDMYVANFRTIHEIAKYFECSTGTVKNRMRDRGFTKGGVGGVDKRLGVISSDLLDGHRSDLMALRASATTLSGLIDRVQEKLAKESSVDSKEVTSLTTSLMRLGYLMRSIITLEREAHRLETAQGVKDVAAEELERDIEEACEYVDGVYRQYGYEPPAED